VNFFHKLITQLFLDFYDCFQKLPYFLIENNPKIKINLYDLDQIKKLCEVFTNFLLDAQISVYSSDIQSAKHL